MNNTGILLGLLALIVGTSCYADNGFPDIPKRIVPTIETLPAQGEIILDVRRIPTSGSTVGIEIGVFDLATQTQAIWDLTQRISLVVPLRSQTMRASWSSRQEKLLLAMADGAYLVDPAGHVQRVNLKMAGTSVDYIDARQFELSVDGAFISFMLEGHELGDKSPDVNDPHKVNRGKYYSELLLEETSGTAPVTIAKSEISFDSAGRRLSPPQFVSLPALNPDRSKMAFQMRGERGNALLEIADIAEGIVTSIRVVHLPDARGDSGIWEIRWSPDGQTLGLIVRNDWIEGSKLQYKSKLFVASKDGQEFREVRFAGKDMNISSFAWSPTGDRFALRTDLGAKTICNHNVFYHAETGSWPCIDSANLYVGAEDGSVLKKISREPEFRSGQLYWIR